LFAHPLKIALGHFTCRLRNTLLLNRFGGLLTRLADFPRNLCPVAPLKTLSWSVAVEDLLSFRVKLRLCSGIERFERLLTAERSFPRSLRWIVRVLVDIGRRWLRLSLSDGLSAGILGVLETGQLLAQILKVPFLRFHGLELVARLGETLQGAVQLPFLEGLFALAELLSELLQVL